MFGIIYTLFCGIGRIISGVKEDLDDAHLKQKGAESIRSGINTTGTYIDSRGRTYDYQTGKQCHVTFDFFTGDRVVEDLHGNVMRNLTVQKRLDDAAKLAAEAPDGTVAVYYDTWNCHRTELSDKYGRVYGRIYKDIKTGELYIKRKYEWLDEDMSYHAKSKIYNVFEKTDVYCDRFRRARKANFYMSVKTGLLVAVGDDEIDKMGSTEEQRKAFMEYFNEKQRNGNWCESEYKKGVAARYYSQEKY